MMAVMGRGQAGCPGRGQWLWSPWGVHHLWHQALMGTEVSLPPFSRGWRVREEHHREADEVSMA